MKPTNGAKQQTPPSVQLKLVCMSEAWETLMVQEHSYPVTWIGIRSRPLKASEKHTDRWKYQEYPSSQNERRHARQHRQDKRRSGAETELPRRPEGETREQSHEDLGESGDGHRLLSVCFNRSFLLSHLLCVLLDPRWS